MEEAYIKFRPLLFSALAELARQGFVAPPSDSLDLIHDFFTEAWEGIESRYDPAKGTLRSYVYASFLRFSRPRIRRMNEFRRQLVDVAFLARLPCPVAESRDLHVELDRELVEKAMAKLPAQERVLLYAYFSAEMPSQRQLAQRLGLSRYRVRASLAEALARLAVHVCIPGHVAEKDWRITCFVLGRDRSLEQAATSFGLTPHQVKRMHTRNLEALVQGLRTSQPLPAPLNNPSQP